MMVAMRKTTISGLYVPKRVITVCNIREASKLAPHYEHVATVGPGRSELGFTHSSHIVETFDDSVDETGPTLQQVRNIMDWYRNLPDDGSVLVHCHAGVSRSTGCAVGFHLVDGASPWEAVLAVAGQQPFDFGGDRRPCWPNGLVMDFLGLLFGVDVRGVVGELCG
jgi:hypothetical protein